MLNQIISKLRDDIEDIKSVFHIQPSNKDWPKDKTVFPLIELLKDPWNLTYFRPVDPYKNWPREEKERFQNKAFRSFIGIVVFFVSTLICTLKWFGNQQSIWGIAALILVISAYIYHQLVIKFFYKKKALIEKEMFKE